MPSQIIEEAVADVTRAMERTVEEIRCYQGSFKHEATVIGWAQLDCSNSHILEVVDLFVEPEYRGNGHARSIITGLVEFARKLGARQISAQAPPDNTVANRVSKQMSFIVCHNEMHLERPV